MTDEVITVGIRARRWGWLVAMAGVAGGLMVRGMALLSSVRGNNPANLQLAFLASSCVLLGGLLLLVRAGGFVWTRGLTEAATLTTCALALLMWVGMVQPYVARAAIDQTLRLVSELSLVADLGLAVVLVCLFSQRPRRTRTAMAIAAGAVCHVATDVGFVVLLAQRGGQVTATRIVGVLGIYAAVGFAVRQMPEGQLRVAPDQAPAIFDPLVGVVMINSVTVVLAAAHEDRVGALCVAGAALLLTAVAATAQWKLHAANETMLRSVDTERAMLLEENMTLMAAHAVATETLAATSHFLSEMTTRVAGPLNGVFEATDRLRDPELTQSADVLLSLMNELLGVAQDATLAPAFSESAFSLRSTIGDALAPYAEAAAAKELAFSVHIDDNVPEMVSGDADRLTELLGLFADNAVAYTDTGVVNVAVNFVETRDDNQYVVYVELTDSGVGLSHYDCYRAFEFDVRAEPNKRRYRGKARGLTKARVLVEQFGGLYGVESELGRGASFWFTVVLGAVDHTRDRAAVSFPAPPPAPGPASATELVLDPIENAPDPEPVVAVTPEPEPAVEEAELEPIERVGFLLFCEDDPLCRRITVAALRRAGYHVDTVTNGVDAVSAVAQRRYDLVLMDVQLPVMSGLEATMAIRSGGANADVPIIAVSAFTSQQQQNEALAAGMDAFVKKPLDLDPLLETLDEWMREHAIA